MSRFKKCAKVAHAKLRTFFPQISLGQTQQFLAAALGHKSYSSFLASDALAFDGHCAFAVLVPESAMLRALDFGIEMNRDHWELLIDEIEQKQVVGDLEICQNLDNVYWRARYEFFDGQDQKIDALIRPHGTVEVFRQLLSEACHVEPEFVDDGLLLPENIYVTMYGEICVVTDSKYPAGWGVPVMAKYGFERIGRRLLAKSVLTTIQQDGPPRRSNPYDELDSAGGMTFD